MYFDNCALGRLTDATSQLRIQNEADAVLRCFARIHGGLDTWVSSEALVEEASRNPNADRRDLVLSLLRTAPRTLPYTSPVLVRATELQSAGLGRYDSLHIAFAESAQADVLLTTDDRLLRSARRLSSSPQSKILIQVVVANPVDWLARR
jgi:predicted nucleic acid-binding protein